MRLQRRAGQQGFTLIELLIVVAIIGIIASILIPNLLDAIQKAKQKRTVADIRITGTAMFSWLTDEVGAAAAGAAATNIEMSDYQAIQRDALTTRLVPLYVQIVPQLDGWKRPYFYFLNVNTPLAQNVMAIVSSGRDTAALSASYTLAGFDPTDYDQDIVWADGFFVRWPQK
jgi:prepilin-type N-terminal cleavage/methylation domain-containing protein